jgi:hypothetical protein
MDALPVPRDRAWANNGFGILGNGWRHASDYLVVAQTIVCNLPASWARAAQWQVDTRKDVKFQFVNALSPRARTAWPNPSIEGMPKRLRLLCTPHVKR